MAGHGGLVRGIVMVVCLGGTALGLANTYGGNAEVVKSAEQAACGREGCSFQKLREERSPLAQRFTFQVELMEKGKAKSASADVECRREFVLLGEYSCKLTSGGLSGP
jgi:hypothetical protein